MDLLTLEVSVSEVSGRMTDSWSPSPSVLAVVAAECPHVAHAMVVFQFRDYFQDPSRSQTVLTQREWDRKFLSWCSRREEAWVDANLRREEEGKEVKFDEVTGMPLNPKPLIYAPKEES